MASLRKKGKRTIIESIVDNLPSFKLFSTSKRSLSETLCVQHDTSEHKNEHCKQNKTLCLVLLLCHVRERFLSNVYDIEEIVEANPVFKNVTTLEVNHVVEAVVADNPIVCEETSEHGLPCTSIALLCQTIISASPGFLAFDPVKFDALIKKHNDTNEKNEAWAQKLVQYLEKYNRT